MSAGIVTPGAVPDCSLIRLKHGFFTMVDEADYPSLAQFEWLLARGGRTFYAWRMVGPSRHRVAIWMHRVVLGLPPGKRPRVDHIDGDGLNNTKANLRLATPFQNGANRRLSKNNTSGYKGVSRWPGPKSDRWQAHIRANGVTRSLGLHPTAEDAARAYDAAAIELHGEFASLNFPREGSICLSA